MPSSAAEGDRKIEPVVVPGHRLGVIDETHDVGRQSITLADDPQARALNLHPGGRNLQRFEHVYGIAHDAYSFVSIIDFKIRHVRPRAMRIMPICLA